MMSEEEIINALREMNNKKVEELEEPSKSLFNAVMKIADMRDALADASNQLQQENQQLKEDYKRTKENFDSKVDVITKYKEVIEKANNELITLIQIIMEQPSKNVEEDNYLLSRLESISNILVGGNNECI